MRCEGGWDNFSYLPSRWMWCNWSECRWQSEKLEWVSERETGPPEIKRRSTLHIRFKATSPSPGWHCLAPSSLIVEYLPMCLALCARVNNICLPADRKPEWNENNAKYILEHTFIGTKYYFIHGGQHWPILSSSPRKRSTSRAEINGTRVIVQSTMGGWLARGWIR